LWYQSWLKSLTRKHVEALLRSESEDDFDVSGDRSENSNSDMTDSESRDESNDDSSDSKCDISTPPVQEKQKVNNWQWNPTCSPSERPTKLPHMSKPIISPELTNNLPENVRCVDIIKQVLATDFWDICKIRQTNMPMKRLYLTNLALPLPHLKRL
jgi:hypothetical protein